MSSSLLAAVRWETGIEDAWRSIITFVPRFVAFLLILLVGWVVAKAVATLVDKALERTGFDRAVERGGVRRALASSNYDASDLVAKLVQFTLVLFVLQLAFGVFGPNPVSTLVAGVIAFLPKLIVAIVIVVVVAAIAAAVKDIVGSALGGLSYGRTLANVAAGTIVVLGAFMALNQVEIAPEIVNGLFYGVLAVIVGSAIVAIGGGGIIPMRQRWERALATVDEEAPKIKERAVSQHNRRQGEETVDLREQPPIAGAPVDAAPVDDTAVLSTQDRLRRELQEERAASAGPERSDVGRPF